MTRTASNRAAASSSATSAEGGPLRTRPHGTALALALLLVTRPATIPADLDVAIPPGAPADWIRALPGVGLSGTGGPPRVRDPATPGSIDLVPRDAVTIADASTAFSGITTIDLPTHLPWTHPQPTPRAAVTGAPEWMSAGWPPPDSHPLHWLAMATLLRTNLHPGLTSVPEALEHLVALGASGYAAAQRAQGEKPLRDLADAVVHFVGAPDASAPRPPVGKTPYETMLLAFATGELASGHPYAPGRPFAGRLRELGSEGLPLVVRLADHTHPFVRQNAVAMLAAYPGEPAAVALRKHVRSTDRVARNRALAALALRGDRGATDELARATTSTDVGLVVLAADALGRAGDPAALDPLRKLVLANPQHADILWAAVPALGRVAAGDERALAALREVAATYTKNPGAFPSNPPAWVVDARDPWTKGEVLAQLARTALARAQDPDAAAALVAVVEGSRPSEARIDAARAAVKTLERQLGELFALAAAARSEGERAKIGLEQTAVAQQLFVARAEVAALTGEADLARANGVALRALAPPARFLACEALGRAGKAGQELLADVVRDATEQGALRLCAFDCTDADAFDAATLERWALGHAHATPPPREPAPAPGSGSDGEDVESLGTELPSELCARALARLAALDAKRARDVAARIVRAFARLALPNPGAKPDPTAPDVALPSMRYWIAIPAMRLLGEAGAGEVDLLRGVIQLALEEERVAAELTRRAGLPAGKPVAGLGTLADRDLSRPAVLDAAVWELGRAAPAEAAMALLADRLADPKAPARAAAALALGGIATRPARERLVQLLDDGDGWVRFAAYRALRGASGLDYPANWLYGRPAERKDAVAKWKAWVATGG